MKKLYITQVLMMLLVPRVAMAQAVEDVPGSRLDKLQPATMDTLAAIATGDAVYNRQDRYALLPYSRRSYFGCAAAAGDSLHLPLMNTMGQVPLMSCPYYSWWGMDSWRLHRGLNMNLGASVFAAFGKGAPSGAGFGQNLSMMYAMPLTDKLSVAVGGWVNNVYWAHDRYTDAGLSAVLGYRFDDRWEAYVYGQKSLVNKPVAYPFSTMHDLGDRIGAAVKYNFSPSFSVQVSVEAVQTPAYAPVRVRRDEHKK